MTIKIDDNEGVLSVRIKDFEDKCQYHKGYCKYAYCSEKTKEEIRNLLKKTIKALYNINI